MYLLGSTQQSYILIWEKTHTSTSVDDVVMIIIYFYYLSIVLCCFSLGYCNVRTRVDYIFLLVISVALACCSIRSSTS